VRIRKLRDGANVSSDELRRRLLILAPLLEEVADALITLPVVVRNVWIAF